LRTIRSSISWASRTALSARRIRSTATTCGEGGGVTRGRTMETTVNPPGEGEGGSPGGPPGTFARRRQLDSASSRSSTRPGRRSVDAERGRTRARCQRARRLERQTGNPVEGRISVPRPGAAVLALDGSRHRRSRPRGSPQAPPVRPERRRAGHHGPPAMPGTRRGPGWRSSPASGRVEHTIDCATGSGPPQGPVAGRPQATAKVLRCAADGAAGVTAAGRKELSCVDGVNLRDFSLGCRGGRASSIPRRQSIRTRPATST
jgi:hypothetical protein